MSLTDQHSGGAAWRDEAGPPRFYAPDLQPLLQSLLGCLADIDFEYDRDCERLSTLDDEATRMRALNKIKELHRQRRDPYVQQLALLQTRMGQFGAPLS
jgi:hypothetical protein